MASESLPKFRRNHLVPVPEADTLAQLNAMIEHWGEAHVRAGQQAPAG